MLTNLESMIDAPEPSEETTSEPILSFPRRVAEPESSPARRMTRGQRWYLGARRVLDFIAAAGLTLLALPIVALAALAVKVTSRGPAFYTQTRTGRNGAVFTIYKIRTMVDKCESLTGPRWTMPGDPRVTPVGWFLRRTHIDELPQLLNVLLGEMSLIGPRPERPEFVGELSEALADYDARHAVLPGITGLAQVQLAPDTDLQSVRKKLVCDLYFIEHLSVWLDARIVVATVLHMAGMSFDTLARLGIVPRPSAVDDPIALGAKAGQQKLAA